MAARIHAFFGIDKNVCAEKSNIFFVVQFGIYLLYAVREKIIFMIMDENILYDYIVQSYLAD